MKSCSIKDLANLYFDAFSKADILLIKDCLSNDIILRDWNINSSGIEFVLSEFMNIFRSLSNLHVNVLHLYECELTVVAEIIITSNELGSIKVVDVLSYDLNGKICSIRAYKG